MNKSIGAPDRIRSWAGAAIADFKAFPGLSMAYGAAFFVLSWLVVGFLFFTGLEWMLLPATAGALMVGPLVAVGLYNVSRSRENGQRPAVASAGQLTLIGGVLMILLLAWIRAATIIFALFFGLRPFSGFLETLSTLFQTPEGIGLVIVGTLVGGLFAALSFAITAYSIPMLVDRQVDAFTAMGRSLVMCLRHMDVTIYWGATVVVLAGVGFLTGFIGMIFVFPLLGYIAWHGYRDMFANEAADADLAPEPADSVGA